MDNKLSKTISGKHDHSFC